MTQVSAGDAKPTDLPAIHGGRHYGGSILLFLVSMLFSAGLAELSARAFWYFRYDVPFTDPGRILYAYYPELGRIARNNPSRGDGFYNVLLLGSSTLSTDYGEVPQALREGLTSEGQRNVRVFNLAVRGQTSRDSRLAYATVGRARFDLVVLYEGINEARANNAPPGVFRDDYGHFSWYEIVNALAPYHGSASVALPYTLHYVALRLRQIVMSDRYVPTEAPREEWLQYGRDHRSVASFKQNLEAILGLASQRGDRLLLMTFATYVPENYSLNAFKKGQLDYDLHLIPIELWGPREDVLETVALENEIVRSEVAQHQGILFVDQAKLMPKSGQYFNDPCHFTVAGSTRFVANLLSILPPAIAAH
jgi:hypothetical protein